MSQNRLPRQAAEPHAGSTSRDVADSRCDRKQKRGVRTTKAIMADHRTV
jgi:hypothetical protein